MTNERFNFSHSFSFPAHRAIIYYFTTTISAVVLGIILVTTIRPGSAGLTKDTPTQGGMQRVVLTQDTLLDLIR